MISVDGILYSGKYCYVVDIVCTVKKTISVAMHVLYVQTR